ncbi:hypothetical protein NZK35_06255 [Stieleria sp. ICT_E10.1]|uniref:hypothetical protein n=1 Tax=Stieleria sedimenti TaxID=2976331 RepID=UPI00217F3C86|nr:hypothetical protein [Stieleria sedimenti]MCS7466276.1 hypothetical protein [Stieleria sedimenti]
MLIDIRVTCCLFAAVFQAAIVIGQDSDPKEHQRYRDYIAKRQVQAALKIESPGLSGMKKLAMEARDRIAIPTTEANGKDLLSLSRELQSKMREIESNDVGRYMATSDRSVAALIQFDTDTISISDGALKIRHDRLSKAIEALEDYQPSTQGVFDPETNPTAAIVEQEVSWINEMYERVISRLAIIATAEAEFDPTVDWSSYPTLQQAKRKVLAKMAVQLAAVETRAEQEALDQSAERRFQSVFDAKKNRFDTETDAMSRIAELSRLLMLKEFEVKEAEFDVKEAKIEVEKAELRKQQTVASNEKRMIETESSLLTVDAGQERIKKYLQSPHVKRLLAPFCTDGWHHTGNALEKGPMSLKLLSNHVAGVSPFEPSKSGLRVFVDVAQGENDRPTWGIASINAYMLPANFVNIDGEKVNPAVEAQRILREHGQLLIELGMLKP